MPSGCYPRKKRIYSIEGFPIDDDLTLQRLGYRAVHVSPGSNVKVTCYCTRCDVVFDRARRQIISEAVCMKCVRRKDEGPVIFSYKEGFEKFEVECISCGRKYKLRRMAFEGTRMCPSCRRKSEVIPNEYILNEETLKRFGYDGATVTSKSHQRVVVRCAECNSTFERIRRNVTEVPICKSCAMRYVDHKKLQNKRRETFIDRYGKEGWIVSNDAYGVAEKEFKVFIEKIIKRPLRTQIHLLSRKIIDLYDSVTQIGIEYNGLNWHHEWSLTNRPYDYHRIKHKDCENEGISLITIFEDEWKAQPLAVENIFRTRFNVPLNKVDIQQCILKEISFEEASVFLNEYYLGGASGYALIAWGLYNGGELIAVTTLSFDEKDTNRAIWDRLCYKPGFHIQGGPEYFLKYLEDTAKDCSCTHLTATSDNRWSTGVVYKQLGFMLDTELEPDYTYVYTKKPRIRLSKQIQGNNGENHKDNKTIDEWAHVCGLARIWDCGKKRWILKL